MQESENTRLTSPHSLSIRSTPDGFSFCYSTAKGKAHKMLKIPTEFDFPERLTDYVQSRGWTEKANLQVTLIDHSDHFMLLPIEISSEEHIKTFFHFQFQQEEESQLFTVPLGDGKQLFCWDMPSSRDQAFENLFPNLTVLSSAYLLANWTIREASLRQRSAMVVHLYKRSMQVFVADPQHLLFANTFPIKDIQEIPYFLLRCLDQLSLDPMHSQCTFCTETVPEQDIIDLFKHYIKKLEMATFTNSTEEPLEIIE